MTYGYASPLFIRQIRNKCAWLALFWMLLALFHSGKVGDNLLGRSWWWAAFYATFGVVSVVFSIGQVHEWRKWDQLLGGAR